MTPSRNVSPADEMVDSGLDLPDESDDPLAEPSTSQESSCNTLPVHKLSAWNAFALLILTQIGAGLFASPTQVDSNVPSPGMALLVWMFACVLGWTGAASFADLATLYPTGGMEEYLARFYGDIPSFLMAWTWITVVKPSSMAMVSTVLVESLAVGLSLGLAVWAKKFLTIIAFAGVVLPNLHSTKTSTRISNIFLVIKLGTVVIVILAGSFSIIKALSTPSESADWQSKSWFDVRPSKIGNEEIDWHHLSAWTIMGHLCSAIYAVLWACTGWDNANFVAREMENPADDLPIAIHGSMSLVTICYQLVNASFYVLVPWSEFSTGNSVAVAAANDLFGRPAAVFVAVLVSLIAAGTVSANVFIISRLTASSSKKGYIPRVFSRQMSLEQRSTILRKIRSSVNRLVTPTSDRGNQAYSRVAHDDLHTSVTFSRPTTPRITETISAVPFPAIMLNLLLTSLYIVFGSFRTLITFNGTAMYTFYFLTLSGLLLRRSRDLVVSADRQAHVYIRVVAPATFCIVSFVILLRTIVFFPAQAAMLVTFLLLGYLARRFFNFNPENRS